MFKRKSYRILVLELVDYRLVSARRSDIIATQTNFPQAGMHVLLYRTTCLRVKDKTDTSNILRAIWRRYIIERKEPQNRIWSWRPRMSRPVNNPRRFNSRFTLQTL